LLGLTFGLFSSGVTEARATLHDEILALQQDVRNVRLSDRIIENPDAGIRYVYLNKCQIEGERELFELTLRSPIEESYVFVPELCVWFETGYAETERTVQFDRLFFDLLIAQFDILYIYHVHPGSHRNLELYFPAYQDFIAMTLINSDFIENSNIQIKHKIITGVAMMDYDFANIPAVKERLRRYIEMGFSKFSAQNLSYDYMRKIYINEYIDSVKLCVEMTNNNSDNIGACNPIVTSLFVINVESSGAFFSMLNSTNRKVLPVTPTQHTQ
jgi:hypothetical protein